MDAFIMDGQAMRSGAVGAVATSKNPVKLARYSPHKSSLPLSSVILYTEKRFIKWNWLERRTLQECNAIY